MENEPSVPRALLVDDSRFARKCVARCLRGAGFHDAELVASELASTEVVSVTVPHVRVSDAWAPDAAEACTFFATETGAIAVTVAPTLDPARANRAPAPATP